MNLSFKSDQSRGWGAVAAGLCIVLGFGLRVYHLGAQSVWWDEAYETHIVEGGLPAIWHLPAAESWNHPPGHWILQAGWNRLAGTSEFSVRFLSVLAGTLLLAVVYRGCRRWLDTPTAVWATALTAICPVYIVYSQEARVYACLPLLYLLSLLALHWVLATQGRSGRAWVALAVAEAGLLYAHFFALLGIAYLNGCLGVWALWRRPRRWVLKWGLSQAGAVILFLPWLLNLAAHLDNLRAQTGGSTWIVWDRTGVTLAGFVQKFGRFMLTGWSDVVDLPPLLGASLVALVGWVGLAALAAWTDKRQRAPDAWVWWVHGGVPLAVFLGMWIRWPELQPRYTQIFYIPWLIGVARLATGLWRGTAWRKLVGGTLMALCLLGSGQALWGYYTDERLHKDDARSVAAYLNQVATAEDVILVGPNDYAVSYYYTGPARLQWASDRTWAERAAQLQALAPVQHHLFVVDWGPSPADLLQLRPFLLQPVGALVDRRYFRGFTVSTWFLERPVAALPELTPLAVRVGPLELTGVACPAEAPQSGWLPVMLRWRAVGTVPVAYLAQIGLTEAQNHRVGGAAPVHLLDAEGRPALRWLPETDSLNFYRVPLTGTLPGQVYSLTVSVSDGFLPLPVEVLEAPAGVQADARRAAVFAASVQIGAPVVARGQMAVGTVIGGWAKLLGYDLDRQAGPGGQPVELRLYWEALPDAPRNADYTVFTQLLAADGHLIAQHDAPPVNYLRPTSTWAAGEVIVDEHRLEFSEPDYTGPATLIVGLYNPQTGERLLTAAGQDHVTLPATLRVGSP